MQNIVSFKGSFAKETYDFKEPTKRSHSTREDGENTFSSVSCMQENTENTFSLRLLHSNKHRENTFSLRLFHAREHRENTFSLRLLLHAKDMRGPSCGLSYFLRVSPTFCESLLFTASLSCLLRVSLAFCDSAWKDAQSRGGKQESL